MMAPHRIHRLTFVVLAAALCKAEAPMNYLTAYGSKARMVLPLTWAVLVVSVVVILVILFFVAAGAWRNGRSLPREKIAGLPVGHTKSGLPWIYIGVGVTGVVLLGTIVWTMIVLQRVDRVPSDAGLTIEVIGHQWWWEVKYRNADPSQIFTTANEIHIPTGKPVKFELKSADVIHSFWVPPLNGKTDTVPGQTNVTWLEASKPGIYRGQCTEYCGLQHAHMALLVIAQSPEDFAAWRRHQLADDPKPATAALANATATFVTRCGSCHSVRGTAAAGIVGPDLSHLMTRKTIAAGTLPNNAGNLAAWIADPQAIKPGAFMPTLGLSGPELVQVRLFLESLK
jgi:cytochrome c oxidase subunit 2